MFLPILSRPETPALIYPVVGEVTPCQPEVGQVLEVQVDDSHLMIPCSSQGRQIINISMFLCYYYYYYTASRHSIQIEPKLLSTIADLVIMPHMWKVEILSKLLFSIFVMFLKWLWSCYIIFYIYFQCYKFSIRKTI